MTDELRNPDGGESYDMYVIAEKDWDTPVEHSEKFPSVAALKLWDQMLDGNTDDTCGNASEGPWSASLMRDSLAILIVWDSGQVEVDRYADSVLLERAWAVTQDNARRDCKNEGYSCSGE